MQPTSDTTTSSTENAAAPTTPAQPATYEQMAHLLRRAGFGASPEDIRLAAARGLEAVTNQLLNYDRVPDTIDDNAFLQTSMNVIIGEKNTTYQDNELKAQPIRLWWVYRIMASPHPLQEKMVLFWHNHFTSKDDDGDFMLRQNKLFRRHALGNFRELAQAVSRDPEMIRYLNGDQNFKQHPNENYARELMELFTCGRVGPDGRANYSEDDVKAAARSFSGWNLKNEKFYFDGAEHDNTSKKFMGQTANFNGGDIVNTLVALPATAHYICRKLFRYFCYGSPEPAALDALVQTYYDSGFDIKAVVGHMLRSTEFYSDKAKFGVIKSPVDFVVGAHTLTGMAEHVAPPITWNPAAATPTDPLDENGLDQPNFQKSVAMAHQVVENLGYLAAAMGRMGQELLAPPNVKGWDGGKTWINMNTMLARCRFAQQFVQSPRLRISLPPELLTPNSALRTVECDAHPYANDPPKLVDSLLWMCGPLTVPDVVRSVLIDQASAETDPGKRVRAALGLIMSCPDYQVC